MAESWRQKRVDIEHWLKDIQSTSPEPLQESDRGLTSNPDIYLFANQRQNEPIYSQSNTHKKSSYIQSSTHLTQDNTLQDTISKLELSSDMPTSPPMPSTESKRTPINEPLATISIQSVLGSGLDTQTAFSVDNTAPKLPIEVVNLSEITAELLDEDVPVVNADRVTKHEAVSPCLKRLRQKSVSPLPLPTQDLKLPMFKPFDQEPSINEKQLLVGRPNHPLKIFSRALTSPLDLLSSSDSVSPSSNRKGSSPVTFDTTKIKLRPNKMLPSSNNRLSRKSHGENLSHDDINQLRENETTTPRIELPVRSLSSEHVLKAGRSDKSCSDSQSSTGACGFGSDLSQQGSSGRDSDVGEPELGQQKRSKVLSFEGKRILSSGSVDVLESRLREKKGSLSGRWKWKADRTQLQSDIDKPSSHSMETVHQQSTSPTSTLRPTLMSPPSPNTHLYRQSRLSQSPPPTPPTSPYHTPIIPLEVRSETRHPVSGSRVDHVRMEPERGFSKNKLRQFNMSQQFSFDTTNEEDLNRPPNQPKFLRNNPLTGNSQFFCPPSYNTRTHIRSHSDLGTPQSLHHTETSPTPHAHRPLIRVSKPSTTKGSNTQAISHSEERLPSSGGRRYQSHVDLFTKPSVGGWPAVGHSIDVEGSQLKHDSSSAEGGNKPLKLFEQIQLQKSQVLGGGDQPEGVDSSSGSGSKVCRQDSGLGTLSTISHKF